MENQNEKKPTTSAGEGKKKRYYKKRKPKAVVANDDVVKAEQGSSLSSATPSDTPTAKPRKSRAKRAYGHPENDQLGLPKLPASGDTESKIVTTVNGQKVDHIKTREAIENAMRISSEMVKDKYAEKDYAKEGAAWEKDNATCGYSDCGCNDACADGDAGVDWDMLLEKLESMNAAIGARKTTFWDRIKAFGSGILAYEKAFLLWLITCLEARIGNGYWAILFGALGLAYFIMISIGIVRSMRYAAYVKELIREGAEAYKK